MSSTKSNMQDLSLSLRMTAVFSIKSPVVSLVRLALLMLIFVFTVMGTYGTMRGGMESTGEGFLHLAYPAMVFLFLFLLSLKIILVRGWALKLYGLRYPEGVLLVAFYAISLLALLGAPQKIMGILTAMVGALTMVLFVLNYVSTRNDFLMVTRMLCGYIWFTAIVAFIAGAQSFYGGAFSVGPIYIEYNPLFWRVNSWFITSTAFGVFQTYGIIATLYLFWIARQRWLKVLLLTIIPLFIFGMGLSGARTAFVVLAIALAALAAARLSLRRRYVYSAIAVFFIGLFAIYWFAPYWEEVYVLRRFLLEDSDTMQMGGRIGMFERSIPLFFELPFFQVLFGSGLGTFQEALNSPIGAHSGLLRILVEHGLLAFFIFVMMMVILLEKLFVLVRYQRKPTAEQKVLLMFVALFFSAELVMQQLMGISIDTLIFFVVLGLALAERRLRALDKRRPNPERFSNSCSN